MKRHLDPHQQEVLDRFLGNLQGGMDPKQFKKVKKAVEGQDIVGLTSGLDSLNHAAPEEKPALVHDLYYSGLRGILKDAGLDDEQRRNVLNGIAGTEVAHPRTQVEG
jgi:hypothetical protein